MSIKIDWQEYPPKQGESDTTGERQYYPRIRNSRKVTDEELFKIASIKSVISRGHFPAAVFQIAKAIAQELMNGNTVTLNDLGTFRLHIGTDTPVGKNERNNVKNIAIKGINFTPSPDFLEMLVESQFEWQPEHVSTPSYTDEAILTELKTWFTTHPNITRQEFCNLFQMSRTTGTNWLNKLIRQGMIEKTGKNKETRYMPKNKTTTNQTNLHE